MKKTTPTTGQDGSDAPEASQESSIERLSERINELFDAVEVIAEALGLLAHYRERIAQLEWEQVEPLQTLSMDLQRDVHLDRHLENERRTERAAVTR